MKRQLFFFVFLLFCKTSYSQTNGDYRSKANAIRWSDVIAWQVYNGTAWVDATAIPTNSLTIKPLKITIVAPATVGSIFYMDTNSGDLKTTDLYINDGVIFQQGYDQSFSTYLSMGSVIINSGGVFRIPNTNLLSNNQTNNDANGGVRNHSFYTQNDLLVGSANGTINPNPGRFIGNYTFSHTPDINGSLTSYTQKLVGYLGNGTHPPASANVVYPPIGGSPAWNMYGTTLPLKLVSFETTLKLNNTSLTWTTEDEVGVSKFEVEKSSDGTTFKVVSTTSAKNNKTRTFYSFNDANVLGGTTYYRLKMIDIDGRFVYSDIKVVNNKVISFVLYPNPTGDALNLQFPSIKVAGSITILNAMGQTLKTINLINNSSNLEVDIRNLNPGIYLIKLEIDGDAKTQQFIKL